MHTGKASLLLGLQALALLMLSLTSRAHAHAQAPEPSSPPPSAATTAEAPSTDVSAAPEPSSPPPSAAYVPAPPVDSEPPNYTPRRHRRSFVPMIVGLGIFVGSYVFSAAVGFSLEQDDNDTCRNCKYGSRLYAPLVGPWLLLPEAHGGAGKAAAATMGVLQGVGLLLSIYGIIHFVSSGDEASDDARAQRFHLALTPLRDGAYGGLHLRW